MKKLLSAFSLNMLAVPSCTIEMTAIRRPQDLSEYQSFIGNSNLARELDVDCYRTNVKLDVGDQVVIANANVRGLHPNDPWPEDVPIKWYALAIL